MRILKPLQVLLTCGLLLGAATLGGCCDEEQTSAPQAKEEPTKKEPVAAKAPEKAAEPAADPEKAPEDPAALLPDDDSAQGEVSADEGMVEIELNADNNDAEVVGKEKAPGENEKMEPADVLHKMDNEGLVGRLEEQGWKLASKEGKEIKNGTEFAATSEDGKEVRIELLKFEDNDAADKYMFKLEKMEEVAFGRTDEKTLAVYPVKEAERRDTRRVLKILMNPPGEKLAFVVDPSDNPPPDPEGGVPPEPTGEEGGGEAAPEGGDAPAPEGGEAAPEGGDAPAEGGEAPAEGGDNTD